MKTTQFIAAATLVTLSAAPILAQKSMEGGMEEPQRLQRVFEKGNYEGGEVPTQEATLPVMPPAGNPVAPTPEKPNKWPRRAQLLGQIMEQRSMSDTYAERQWNLLKEGYEAERRSNRLDWTGKILFTFGAPVLLAGLVFGLGSLLVVPALVLSGAGAAMIITGVGLYIAGRNARSDAKQLLGEAKQLGLWSEDANTRVQDLQEELKNS